MSEEILKALTQLFAIITKQDEGVTEIERQWVINFFKQKLSKDSVDEYLALYEEFLNEKPKRSRDEGDSDGDKTTKLTSMKDSVRTLSICKKINKTLTQKQKAIVLIELIELVVSDNDFSPQQREIVNTVSDVFNIDQAEYDVIEKFVIEKQVETLNFPEVLICSEHAPTFETDNFIRIPYLDDRILFLHVKSVDLYFVKILGDGETILNNTILPPLRVQLFSDGSTLKPAKGTTLYYSDIVAHFNKDVRVASISFNCKNLEFKFPNGATGLRNINISENRGKLIGIMGASGAGKTTLLNVLAGLEMPSQGAVLINGIDIHQNSDLVKGVIGYIAQDDILIEDLSVFENLYFNAKLCFKELSEAQVVEKVHEVLSSLGLEHIQHLKVGNVLNKKISGGQRKRLNIALELIREPAVMFVDEPTSGLSSRDSENVMDLLKELSLKGKLIFVVIHQPSSDIYKKFDKMFIMDTGGYPIFYGNPIDAIVHFKRATHQINSEKGQCNECGNVNPEQLFDIVEARVVNEFGKLTTKRKVTPTQWAAIYDEQFPVEHVPDKADSPPNSLKIPTRFVQWWIFTLRDFKSKLSNTQYLVINLLEAPLLALTLAFIIKYTNSPTDDDYFLRYNENLPAFILMSIIVALFMGLTVSAEEIIRDRKILRREQFLSLSKNSYMLSKVGILFLFSAVQTLCFVLVGHLFLEIQGMALNYWLMLFSISCFANLLGLNISASFNTAVTVYIVIPLLLIPQMVLSGALFRFDKLNDAITTKGKAPIIADVMASRWAYEGLAVEQFKNNEYQKHFFNYDFLISNTNYKQAYLLPEIGTIVTEAKNNLVSSSDSLKKLGKDQYKIVCNEVLKLHKENEKHTPFMSISKINPDKVDLQALNDVVAYLDQLNELYNNQFVLLNQKKDQLNDVLKKLYLEKGEELSMVKNEHFNESLDEILRNVNTKHRLIRYQGHLVRQIDPVFQQPEPQHLFDYRSAFYAPEKHFMGKFVDTFVFNVMVIWCMTLFLYVTLYYEFFRRIIEKLGNISWFKKGNDF